MSARSATIITIPLPPFTGPALVSSRPLTRRSVGVKGEGAGKPRRRSPGDPAEAEAGGGAGEGAVVPVDLDRVPGVAQRGQGRDHVHRTGADHVAAVGHV